MFYNVVDMLFLPHFELSISYLRVNKTPENRIHFWSECVWNYKSSVVSYGRPEDEIASFLPNLKNNMIRVDEYNFKG